MKLSQSFALLLLVGGCASPAVKPTPQSGPSLARAMCEAGYSFVALQRALADPANHISLGQRPCSAQITFHVTASETGNQGLNLKLAIPIYAASAEVGGTQSTTTTSGFDNQMNMQVENPVCSVKDYLAAMTKSAKDKKTPGVSIQDVEALYDKFDKEDRREKFSYSSATIEADREQAIKKCAAYDRL